MDDERIVLERTRNWLEEIVIGWNLCPFAAKPHRRGEVSLSVQRSSDFDEAMGAVLQEAGALLGDDDIATTLAIFPDALADFDEFLDGCAAVEALLEQSGADEYLQIAHFHPDYRFEGVPADDPANYTNRAPYPIIQLLRVDEVADALAGYGDPDEIYERNIALLRDKGLGAVREALERATGGQTSK